MCVGDWRLGRLIRSRGNHLVPIGNIIGTLPRNQQRVGVTFCAFPSTEVFTLAVRYGGVETFTVGQFITTALVQHYTIVEHGDLPMQEFLCVVGAGGTVEVIEYFLPEDALHMLPDAIDARR